MNIPSHRHPQATKLPPAPASKRGADALYQRGQIVGRAANVEVDLEAKKIRFGEIHHSDHLVLADECEYQDYILLIQRVAYATKIDKADSARGRVLRGCVADILRSRES